MANPSQVNRCMVAEENLDKLEEEQRAQQRLLSRLEEQVDLRRGEVAQSQDRLSRIVEAIDEVAVGAVGAAADILRRDPVSLAGNLIHAAAALSRLRAEQNRRVSGLRRQLDDDTFNAQAARNKLDIISNDIHRTNAFLDSNCR